MHMNINSMQDCIDKRTLPRKLSPRREIARSLKTAGKTYQEIGIALGISRQRVQQLVRPTAKEREQIITKCGNKCFICGKENERLDIHHLDYKTNEAIVLCISCHRKEHGMEDGRTSILTTAARIRVDDLEILKRFAAEDMRTLVGELRWLIQNELARRGSGIEAAPIVAPAEAER